MTFFFSLKNQFSFDSREEKVCSETQCQVKKWKLRWKKKKKRSNCWFIIFIASSKALLQFPGIHLRGPKKNYAARLENCSPNEAIDLRACPTKKIIIIISSRARDRTLEAKLHRNGYGPFPFSSRKCGLSLCRFVVVVFFFNYSMGAK